MFRRVMPVEFLYNSARFLWSKSLVKSSGFMSIQVVAYQHDLIGLRKMHIHHLFEAMSPVHIRLSIGHFHVAPPFEGGKDHKQGAHPVAIVFIIIALGLARLTRQGRAGFLDLLLARLVSTEGCIRAMPRIQATQKLDFVTSNQ